MCVFFYRTEHVQTTPVDSKLKFAQVSYVLATVKKWHENRLSKCIKCTGLCAESTSCFFAPNMSKQPHWTPNSIHYMYLMFPATTKNGTKTGPADTVNALVRALEVRLLFSDRTCPKQRGGIQTQVRACILCFGHRKKRRENGPRQSIKCTGSCAECASSFFAPNMSKPP